MNHTHTHTHTYTLVKALLDEGSARRSDIYEACPESKDTWSVGREGNFYAYYGNTAVDFDPLPISRALMTVVEPALFE
jgi:hypothetical protein